MKAQWSNVCQSVWKKGSLRQKALEIVQMTLPLVVTFHGNNYQNFNIPENIRNTSDIFGVFSFLCFLLILSDWE